MPPVQALSDLPGEAWLAVGAVLAAVVGGSVTMIVERFKAAQRFAQLVAQVEEVRRLSAPTGNGFATEVRAALTDLKKATGTNAAVLGDVSAQIAALDKRMWDHVSQHGPTPRWLR